MSDTPMTDARLRRMLDNDIAPNGLDAFARRLERELNAANARIKALEARVARLEEAGDACAETATTPQQIEWRKAKESKP